jgi:uncharacterized heparinase superfamily protein
MGILSFRGIKTKIDAIKHASFLYNLSLDGLILKSSVPDRLIVRPPDAWAGCPERGEQLCDGLFSLNNDTLQIRGHCWHPVGVSQKWLNNIHGFSWLRDLRTTGGDRARQQGYMMIESWLHTHRLWHPVAWEPAVTGRRIALWISHYDFFLEHADEDVQDLFFTSLNRQARHLQKLLPGSLNGLDLLEAAKGLLYCGLALQGREFFIEQALEIFEKESGKQILSDGGHISRSPRLLKASLQIFLDVKNALLAAGYPLPERLQFAIDRMGPALKFFIGGDRHFALMNGAQSGNPHLTESILAQAGVRGRGMESLPASGYERVSQGRSLLIFDTGKSPPWPYDAEAHAAPLSFEFSYGKERIFVSCGAHPTSEEWNESLRATAAHNTLCIDHRNACEIKPDGHFGRKVKMPFVRREDGRHAALIEGTHDGYMQLSGITHSRRIFLCEQGSDLRGEDTLESAIIPTRAHDIAIRFHIHPRVMVSLLHGGGEALLRLPSGMGWRFQHTGGTLSLDHSVYLGENGQPRRTRQLVINSQMTEDYIQFKWALQREGI